ncbi:hypothetical protein CEP52_004870 [Fusarium oligoseptatum]|uniref:Uncharacterized protein n=1 Tax=Fusarium oligoseptatum TaxID=2604345 RepID=A0A428U1N2_9HYPO|nr:hypothetical protein CEP52_004870 [Fusarium oligoseptatum]
MPRDSSSPGQDDDHAEKAVTLQAFLSTAKEVIPVFTSALARTSLLRSGLSVLQLKLIGLSNPHELLALETPVLTKLSDCLRELFYQLDGLVDKDVQEKARYFHGIVQQHIDSQPNDPELCPEEIAEKRQDQGKRTKWPFQSSKSGSTSENTLLPRVARVRRHGGLLRI